MLYRVIFALKKRERGEIYLILRRERMKLKASRNQRSNGVKAKLRKISIILSYKE
jgi:hypothetical protein